VIEWKKLKLSFNECSKTNKKNKTKNKVCQIAPLVKIHKIKMELAAKWQTFQVKLKWWIIKRHNPPINKMAPKKLLWGMTIKKCIIKTRLSFVSGWWKDRKLQMQQLLFWRKRSFIKKCKVIKELTTNTGEL